MIIPRRIRVKKITMIIQLIKRRLSSKEIPMNNQEIEGSMMINRGDRLIITGLSLRITIDHLIISKEEVIMKLMRIERIKGIALMSTIDHQKGSSNKL